MTKILSYVLLTIILYGCSGSPAMIAASSPAQLSRLDMNALLGAYITSRGKNAENELRRRKVFTPKEWANIKKRNVVIGMKRSAVYASWGWPRDTRKITNAKGTYELLIYGRQKVFLVGKKVYEISS